MNKAAVLGAIAVVAVGSVVGGAKWSGVTAKREVQANIAKMEQSMPIKATQSTFEEGLFSTTHTMVLKLACGAEEGPGLTVRQRIKHGPLPGWTRIGRAVVETEVDLPQELRALLQNPPPEGQPLLKASTTIGLTGGFETRVTSPKLELHPPSGAKGQASIQPLDFRAQSSLQGNVSYELAWAGMAVTSEEADSNGSFALEGLSIKGQARPGDKNPLWFMLGKGELELQRIAMATQNPMGKPVKIEFTKIVADSDTTLDKELLNRVSHLRGQGAVNGAQITNIKFDASVRRLHAPTYVQMLQEMYKPEALCGASSDPTALMEQAEATAKAMATLLVHDPEIAVETLEFEVDGKPGKASYTVGTKGVTTQDVEGSGLQAALFAKTYAYGNITIPMAWVERVMVDKDPQRQPQDQAVLDAMLSQAVDAGYVVKEGSNLSSQFKLEKGQLLVNSKPVGPQLSP